LTSYQWIWARIGCLGEVWVTPPFGLLLGFLEPLDIFFIYWSLTCKVNKIGNLPTVQVDNTAVGIIGLLLFAGTFAYLVAHFTRFFGNT